MIRTLGFVFALCVFQHAHASTGLTELYQQKTLVSIRTISYTIINTDGTQEERLSQLFRRFTNPAECMNDENRDLYTDFELITITEHPQNDSPALSQWIEGSRIQGTVIQKETQLCFATATTTH